MIHAARMRVNLGQLFSKVDISRKAIKIEKRFNLYFKRKYSEQLAWKIRDRPDW